MGSHSPILAFHRVEIEVEIELHLRRVEMLIARLDRFDGDPDLEDDDPAGGNVEDEGEREEGYAFPLYALDQSRGPLTREDFYRAREMGA